jgi:hypothetical protein
MSNDCGTIHQRIRIEQHTFMGTAWCAAWLFTIGSLPLNMELL